MINTYCRVITCVPGTGRSMSRSLRLKKWAEDSQHGDFLQLLYVISSNGWPMCNPQGEYTLVNFKPYTIFSSQSYSSWRTQGWCLKRSHIRRYIHFKTSTFSLPPSSQTAHCLPKGLKIRFHIFGKLRFFEFIEDPISLTRKSDVPPNPE